MRAIGPWLVVAVGLLAAMASWEQKESRDLRTSRAVSCIASTSTGAEHPEDAVEPRIDAEEPAGESDASVANGQGEVSLDPEMGESPQYRPWEVVVLDPAGEPIAGVTVMAARRRDTCRVDPLPDEMGITDAEGHASLLGEAEEECFEVVTKGVVPWKQWTLCEPRTVLQYRDILPLEVVVVDARTGHAMGTGCAVTLVGALSGERSLDWLEDRFVLNVSPAWRSGPVSLRFKVDVPQGFAVLTRETQDSREIVSSYATGVRARVIARPEAQVRLRFLDAEGSPVPGVGVQSATFGWIYPQDVGADLSGDDGVLVVRGVPDLPGEVLRLIVEGTQYSAAVEPIALTGDGAIHEATVVLRGAYRGPSGSVNGCPRFTPDPEAPEGGTSTVEFTVRRQGGGVAAGAMVRLEGECLRRAEEGPAVADTWRLEAAADADGQVTFVQVPGGRVFAEVRQVGFVWMREEFDVAEGEALSIEIREPVGRTVRVAVTDPRGNPIPYASVDVRLDCGVAYAPPCEGVQDLGLWTDRSGICEIAGMPETDTVVFAQTGSRFRSGRLVPGQSELWIELPDGY